MKRINHKKNLTTSIILLLILLIGIGYAYLTSNLSITGATEVVANTWNIHFENLNVKEGSVIASSSAIINNDNTSITYSITLSRPKDYYEFTVDVKNDGTLPGKVSVSTLSGITSEAESVIDYSVTYTNGKSVNVGDIINAGGINTIKVRVFYKDDISASDFPSNNSNLTLTYTLQYIQSEEDANTLGVVIDKLINEETTCMSKYTGEVTDNYNETVNANKVYFNNCVDKNNIIFANQCWQMIRTTENRGVKVIYNGEVVNNKCLSTRPRHKIIYGSSGSSATMDSYSLNTIGNYYTFDTSTNEFILQETSKYLWNESSYKNFLGKFYCGGNLTSCTTINIINSYYNTSSSHADFYSISDYLYDIAGFGDYNATYNFPIYVGYMFNDNVKYSSVYTTQTPITGAIISSSYTYNNNKYVLSGETMVINNWSSNYSQLSNKHYMCEGGTSECENLYYIYKTNNTMINYVLLTNGKSITDVINEALINEDVNQYDSDIKGLIDNWYRHYLFNYTTYIEDTVYCNDRTITNYGMFDPSSTINDASTELTFSNYDNITSLSCPNLTDRFSLANNKAKLQFPVGLVTAPELRNITFSDGLLSTGGSWTSSPRNYNRYLENRIVQLGYASVSNDRNDFQWKIKPVISLKRDNIVSEGTGSKDNPWIIE